MKPFTKLFSSIISSSIWRAPKETKVVWITMLAMSDKDGEVWASVGGLADMARVTKDEARKALDELLAPDDDSRTKEHEGRRIEAIEGGWRVLNYKKYRDLGRGEDRREYFAENKRINRARAASTNVHNSPRLSPIAEAEAEAERGRETPAPAPSFIDTKSEEGPRKFLESLGAKTRKGDEDLIGEWRAVTKGVNRSLLVEIFKQAKPGILWPSEFKQHRAARGSY